MRVSMSELRAALPKYIDLAAAGTPVTVTLHGRAVAVIEPVAGKSRIVDKPAPEPRTVDPLATTGVPTLPRYKLPGTSEW